MRWIQNSLDRITQPLSLSPHDIMNIDKEFILGLFISDQGSLSLGNICLISLGSGRTRNVKVECFLVYLNTPYTHSTSHMWQRSVRALLLLQARWPVRVCFIISVWPSLVPSLYISNDSNEDKQRGVGCAAREVLSCEGDFIIHIFKCIPSG